MALKVKANEKTSTRVTGTFIDKDGDALPASALDVLLLTIHHTSDSTLRIRSSDDALNDSNITIGEDGAMVWDVQPFETEILQPASVRLGSIERHTAVFEYAWQSPRTGSLTSPFATTSGSKTVTVTHASHGLAVRDHVYFVTSADIAGLDFGGHYIVRSVIDANSYTVEHFTAADATVASGGGNVTWFAGGDANSTTIEMQIKRVDPI